MLTLKTILLALFAMVGSAALGAGAYAVYTPLQISLPFDAALKTTPDPANIWSWHKTVSLPAAASLPETAVEPVLIDMNGDGVMDTNEPGVRVLVTDVQVLALRPTSSTVGELPYPDGMIVRLKDSTGSRWFLPPSIVGSGSSTVGLQTSVSFSTPLALPVGSDLSIELTRRRTNNPMLAEINLIGRIVNL